MGESLRHSEIRIADGRSGVAQNFAFQELFGFSSQRVAQTSPFDVCDSGRLAGVDGGATRSYTYNALGQQAEWAGPGFRWEFDRDLEGHDAGVLDGNGSGWYNQRFARGTQYLAVYTREGTTFVHVNALQSSTMDTQQDGSIGQDVIFYPWGKLWASAPTSGFQFFAGIPDWDWDMGTGLTQARPYTIGQGRWLTPDPNNAGADPSNPQSWNAYSYAGNNPTTFTDPSGEDYELCVNNDDGDTKCTHIQNEAAFQAALANPGTGITIKGTEQSGVIYGTDANGNAVQEGTYKQVVGPGTEGGGIQDASAPLVGLVAGGVSLIRSVGADLFEGLFERETPEGGVAGTTAVENPVITPEAPEVTLTQHAAERASERGMTQADIDAAVRTAKETGQVTRQVGKYGTPQNIYKGMNNITVVVETAGRNAGKAVTVFRTQ